MYIDDCMKGTQMIMNSEMIEPINLGSAEMVTINQLIDIVESIAGDEIQARVRSLRTQGRQWPQQRQHQDQSPAALGAQHLLARRSGENLPLDL